MPQGAISAPPGFQDVYKRQDMETVPAGPEIRAILLNKAPKFGNDDERADKWVVELEDYIGSSYRYKYRSSKSVSYTHLMRRFSPST